MQGWGVSCRGGGGVYDTPLPTPIWHTPPHPYMTHPTPTWTHPTPTWSLCLPFCLDKNRFGKSAPICIESAPNNWGQVSSLLLDKNRFGKIGPNMHWISPNNWGQVFCLQTLASLLVNTVIGSNVCIGPNNQLITLTLTSTVTSMPRIPFTAMTLPLDLWPWYSNLT